MHRLILFSATLFITLNCFGQNYTDSLDFKLKDLYLQKHLPGFATAIVNQDGVLYKSSFGFADLSANRPYSQETVQSVASVSKTTISIAVMKLLDEGKLSLNSPINNFLPYQVINPNFKDSVITIKHLVSHTSGIVDTDENYDLRNKYFIKKTNLSGSALDPEYLDFLRLLKLNRKMSLQKYCKTVFSEKGKWYSKNTFLNHAPGHHYQYTNVGAVLMAHIVERVSGKKYFKYIESEVFDKLDMNYSTFKEKKVDDSLKAKSYITDKLIATPILGDNTYPDGGMLTNCRDLSIYLIEIIKGFNGKGKLLSPLSYKKMFHPSLSSEVSISDEAGRNFDNIGVFWHLSPEGLIYHNGGNPYGGTVYMSFDPIMNIGRILMTNCDVRSNRETIIEFISIWRTMSIYQDLLQVILE